MEKTLYCILYVFKQIINTYSEPNHDFGNDSLSFQNLQVPIRSIADVLTPSFIEKHLDSLSNDELKLLYSRYLPPSHAENTTKEGVVEVTKSAFFQQYISNLSRLLNYNTAGYMLSQNLNIDYEGEGVENFLRGIKRSSSRNSR